MTGIDTNVLVRYVTQDDPIQSPIATRWIESQCTSKHPGWINRIVLCEMVWVLIRGYHYEKKDVIRLLERLIETEALVVESGDEVRNALSDYSQGNADFSDYLIAQTNISKKVRKTVTFDTKASHQPNWIDLKNEPL